MFPYAPREPYRHITKRLIVQDTEEGICYVVTLRWAHLAHRDDRSKRRTVMSLMRCSRP